MTWFRLESHFRDDLRLPKLGRALGVTTHHARGLYVTLEAFVCEHHPDGDLSELEPADIAYGAQWDGDPDVLVEALERLELIERHGETRTIERWEEKCEGYKRAENAKARRKRKKTQAQQDEATRARRVPDACPTRSDHVARRGEERKGEEKRGEEPSGDAPDTARSIGPPGGAVELPSAGGETLRLGPEAIAELGAKYPTLAIRERLEGYRRWLLRNALKRPAIEDLGDWILRKLTEDAEGQLTSRVKRLPGARGSPRVGRAPPEPVEADEPGETFAAARAAFYGSLAHPPGAREKAVQESLHGAN